MTDDAIIWIDLEMSGLDVSSCRIIEIASVVTDGQLEIVAKGPDIVIHQPAEVLDAMDEWNTEHHGRSGLIAEVQASTVDARQAETATLEFLGRHCAAGRVPLAGNSVSNDRTFLDRYMPELAEFLHYRTIDVSTIKELARRWYGDTVIPAKSEAHRALGDILESIEELRHYRRTLFVKGN